MTYTNACDLWSLGVLLYMMLSVQNIGQYSVICAHKLHLIWRTYSIFAEGAAAF